MRRGKLEKKERHNNALILQEELSVARAKIEELEALSGELLKQLERYTDGTNSLDIVQQARASLEVTEGHARAKAYAEYAAEARDAATFAAEVRDAAARAAEARAAEVAEKLIEQTRKSRKSALRELESQQRNKRLDAPAEARSTNKERQIK